MPENNSTTKQSWTQQRGPLRWVKRHKKLTVVLVILVVVVSFAVSSCMRAAKAVSNAMAYQFVRTTTLQKTSLVNSVSVNGTVASGSKASVTASDSVKTCKVTSVHVAVGDTVHKGDVIATLDTTNVEKQIENAQQSYNDTLQDASTSFVQSVEDQTTNLAQLQEDLDKARQDYDTLELDRYSSMANPDTASMTNRELVEYYYGLYTEQIAGLENTVANLQIQLTQAQSDGNPDRQKEVQGQLNDYQNKLSVAKGQCSIPELGLQGFETITQYYEKIKTLKQTLDAAQQKYDDAATTNSRNVDKAGTQLERAQREPTTLEDLQATLDDCTLTATMDGTITELNATVGSVCSGTVATIQDVADLTVEVTVPANSVGQLTPGMQCKITSDATGSTETSGTLTRIDPVANDKGSFGATVTINNADSGLLIGIPAKVEIIITQKDNIFTVPRDAVGTAEDGSSYVLRRTGGEDVNMTFEEVPVTTGDANDYYIEVNGNLAEGDVIRASADLTQGIEATTKNNIENDLMGEMMTTDDGGAVPEPPADGGPDGAPAAAPAVGGPQ